MKGESLLGILVTGLLLMALTFTAPAQNINPNKHMQAKGTFEVKTSPAEGTALEKEAGIGRLTIDKQWSGDLTGTSKGIMLTSFTESTGAMAYVAMENVEAKLGNRMGSFYFSHTATMKRGDAASGVLKIVVVTGSGTGELAGLSGELTINIDKGQHSYVFDYEMP